ncbi:MAG: sulfate ABC transporter substrate-binding protein [Verrucomicrobiales bacterium]|jgi:sulfate transport system substrate-binding protein|nr:sulfate ABC transporter substrate-binding protein [Verrucomicrobiales bacterium]
MNKTYRYFAAGLLLLLGTSQLRAETQLLNVSYDVARELYGQIDPAFAAYWKNKTGESLTVKESFGGSSKQARAVVEGLEADVVTLNQVSDVELLHKQGGLIGADWQKQFPYNSSPYYSVIGFVVRKGNPKGIKNWDDLVKPGVQVIFPNPKTSGNGRYTYLAAWAYAGKKFNGDQAKVQDFINKLVANVPVFDTGGRGATTTFVERQIGDVLITFEAETLGIQKQYGKDKFDVFVPGLTIAAEFPVAVVDKYAAAHKTARQAKAFIEYLYSPEAQDILARNFYRVRDNNVAAKYASQFPNAETVTAEQLGGWEKIGKTHFSDGGTFDQAVSLKR